MKSFLSDRPRVDAPTVHLENSGEPSVFSPAGFSAKAAPHAHAHGRGGTAGADAGGTRVDCVREGDRITRLVITCSCGERIEIDCLYAAGR